jgi:hypothetical protein
MRLVVVAYCAKRFEVEARVAKKVVVVALVKFANDAKRFVEVAFVVVARSIESPPLKVEDADTTIPIVVVGASHEDAPTVVTSQLFPKVAPPAPPQLEPVEEMIPAVDWRQPVAAPVRESVPETARLVVVAFVALIAEAKRLVEVLFVATSAVVVALMRFNAEIEEEPTDVKPFRNEAIPFALIEKTVLVAESASDEVPTRKLPSEDETSQCFLFAAASMSVSARYALVEASWSVQFGVVVPIPTSADVVDATGFGKPMKEIAFEVEDMVNHGPDGAFARASQLLPWFAVLVIGARYMTLVALPLFPPNRYT